jgi:hypothetical protein
MEAVMREALCIAVVGVLLIAALIDVVAAGVKTSVVRSHYYSAAPASGRDSRACEHEKLSDGAVAAVICYLHFQLTAPTLPSVVAGAAVFTIAAAPC